MLSIFKNGEKLSVSQQFYIKCINDIDKDETLRLAIPNKFGKTLSQFLNLNLKTGPCLAGGMLRKLHNSEQPGESDWDIWFASETQFQQAYKKLNELNSAYKVHESDNAVTFIIQDNTAYKVQIIKKNFYNSAQEVIDNFDFTVTQLVSDGEQIIAGKYTYRDLATKTLRLTSPTMINRPGIFARIVKYVSYGYKIDAELAELINNNRHIIAHSKFQNNDYDDVI